MTKTKVKQATTIIFLILITLICIALLLLAFGKEKNITTWDNIYRALGLKTVNDLSDDFVRIIDVDQGDSILISSNGKNMMLDTGPPKSASLLYTHLLSSDVDKLDALFLTHFHDDHIGGIETLSDKFSIDTLILPDFAKSDEDTDPVKVLRSDVLKSGGKVFTAVRGMTVDMGDCELTVLAYYKDLKSENSKCIVTMARFDDKKFLLMSDATKDTEKLLLDEGLNLDCDVIKIGHHGSTTSTSKELLRAASPEYAVISCGLGNNYIHPHEQTVALIEEMEIDILRTDIDGSITFYKTETGMDVLTEGKY